MNPNRLLSQNPASGLLLDLYELTMAASFFEHKLNVQATFDLFVRRLPQDRSFLVAAGLEGALKFLQGFSFTQEDLDFLKQKAIFKDDFLNHLKTVRFRGSVDALSEGTVFFPNEPILRLSAPILEAQLAESYLLNTINAATTICTKAARVVLAAGVKGVYDFSLRRTHGPEAGMVAARSSYIAGCLGTSNVLAGSLYGIPISGTMAHSFVMSFKSELDSFRAYVSTFPDASTLLVDTYDCRRGIDNAIMAAKELEQKGHKLKAIRLDSGDLAKISQAARSSLNRAGLSYVKIFASGNLDEFKIEKLIKSGSRIDNFGVGTNMGVSSDAPYLDVIYKLSQTEDSEGRGHPVMKLSKDKVTYPGKKQVFRVYGKNGRYAKDILALEGEKIEGKPLLAKVMENGAITMSCPGLEKIRDLTQRNIKALPDKYKRLRGRAIYPVLLSKGLRQLVSKVKEEIAAAAQ